MGFQALIQIETAFRQAGDVSNSDKVQQLIEKAKQDQLMIAFCGHFSAGKSSMINHLLEGQVLPSSPIPTSANLVTIENGPSAVQVWQKDGTGLCISVNDLERLREFATNSGEIERIQIQIPTSFLPEGVLVMDTPGIDSTDDAHRIATESALHLADLVVYVMDYNHVQSEVNFDFTKTLKDRGKLLWLVVNQIDKHNDFELSFAEYQNSVKNAFAAWGIEPDGIFYTTLKDERHPHDQMLDLQAALQALFRQKQILLEQSLTQSASYLIEDHLRFIKKQHESERDQYLALLNHAAERSALDAQGYRQHLQLLEMKRAQANWQVARFQEELERDVLSLIENAILIPFQTTELCGQFLESRRPNFRVGFLFAGGKTEQERERRLQELHVDFTGRVAANLDWHLKDLLSKRAGQYGIRDEDYKQAVYGLEIEIPPQKLVDWIKEGALGSQEYMYQYAKDIAAEVKSMYRRAAAELTGRAVQLSAANQARLSEQLQEQITELQQLLTAAEGIERLAEQEDTYAKRLLAVLSNGAKRADKIEVTQAAPSETFAANAAASDPPEFDVDSDAAQTEADQDLSRPAAFKTALLHMAQKLRTAEGLIRGIPGMQTISRHMTERAVRLEQNVFTVALFGAFSAGKSSFANAMMGERVLPVSPNPTTATINKILPPTTEYTHGQVRVKLKSIAEMIADIQGFLAIFSDSVSPSSIDVQAGTEQVQASLQAVLGSLSVGDVPPAAKPHFSFLKAVSKGLPAMRPLLGTEVLIDLKMFRQYVAEEEKAVFVEWIELYYDCPLTRQGIVLIDTPGADSINARHTKVAFDYIKNADAVLFVTYYNHAFSNADREFLIQLGRVKDSFELDKMFFLVNAADLASDEAELADVVTHVKQNLLACSITKPRIYPVSSQLALLARLAAKHRLPASAVSLYRKLAGAREGSPQLSVESVLQQSGIASFEQDFVAFTIEEITEMAAQSALAEIRRAKITLLEMLETAKQGEAERKLLRNSLAASLQLARQSIDRLETDSELQLLEKEVEELVYYVKQRVFFRFTEAFNEAFSSSVLRDDAGDGKKRVRQSMQELIRFIGFDLAQEMRATAIRVENQINKSGQTLFEKSIEQISPYLKGFTVEPLQKTKLEIPDFSEELPNAKIERFAGSLAFYKSAKDFFERDTKSKMRDEIERQLQEPIANYLRSASAILKEYYGRELRLFLLRIKQSVTSEMEDYVDGMKAALSLQMDIGSLEKTIRQLEELL